MRDSRLNPLRERDGHETPDVINAPVGSEVDVTSVALHLNSREINAITIAGEPFGERRARVLELIGEIEARMDASPRGHDLEPLLHEAQAALRMIEEQERDESGRQPS
ncbi:MAG TPA: hypothetical protein VN112_18905 [Ensifer sp.]|nr:hypothetical protein [Ensifer sp.]